MKKISSILSIFIIGILIFSGCSSSSESYLDDVNRVSSWKSMESSDEFNVKLSFKNMQEINGKAELPFKGNVTTYADQSGDEVIIDSIYNISDESGENKYENLRMILTNQKIYLDKRFFKIFMSFMGTDPLIKDLTKKVDSLEQEYVVISTEDDANTKNTPKIKSENITLSQKLHYFSEIRRISKKADIDLGIVKSEENAGGKKFNKYVLNMDSDAVVDKTVEIIEFLLNNPEDMYALIGDKGEHKKEIEEFKNKYEKEIKPQVAEMANNIKQSIKGSSFSLTEKIGEDFYEGEFGLNIKHEMVNLSLFTHNITKPAEKRKVELPSDSNTISYEEFNKKINGM